MATVYKLLHRTQYFRATLRSLVTDPEYVRAAQAAIAAYNTKAVPEKRIKKDSSGQYIDKVTERILHPDFWAGIELFLQASKVALYLLRLVDTCAPCLGKVYYSCALIGKHLAILSASKPTSVAPCMKQFFVKRWSRWHHPIHTLAYALDPSYQTHQLSPKETKECKQMIYKLRPSNGASVFVEFNSFRTEPANFEPPEWRAADDYHGYQWWDTFGSVLPLLQSVGVDVLSKAAAASACEFNWSQVSSIERKERGSLHTATTCACTNVAAMHHLNMQTERSGVDRNLPKLENVIEAVVESLEDEAPLPAITNLSEAVGPGELCEDDEVEADGAEAEAAFTAAEMDLYADWHQRDGMLPDPH